MPDVPAIDQSQVASRIVEILKQTGRFVASEEFKALMKRFSDVVAKNPHHKPASPTKKSRFEDWASFFTSAAIHGIFIGMWAEFDLAIEVLIMKFSRMSEKSTSIICTPIQGGHKMQILISLINEEKEDEIGTALLKNVQAAASRNIFIHGFWNMEDNNIKSVSLYYREAYTKYTVRKRPKNWKDAANHILEFLEAIVNVYIHFNLSEEDLANYKKSIVDLEPIHASRAERNQRPRTNSEKATKKQPPSPPESSRS